MYRKFLVLGTLLAVLAAACGDSGSTDEPEATEPAATATTAEDSDTLPPITVVDVPGIDDDCEALVNVFLSMTTIFSGGEMPEVSADAFDDLPGDIRDDAKLVLETFDEFTDELAEIGIDLSDPQSLASLTEAQQQQFVELSEAFDAPEFNTAIDNLEKFGQEECSSFVPTP
jgi:hypothetical protein